MWKTILWAVLLVLLTACTKPAGAPAGTKTPIPSNPPQPTPSSTPTLIVITLPTTQTPELIIPATPIGIGSPRPELSCKLLSQSVKSGSKFAARQRFDISWAVQNTGTVTWEPGIVELVYAGGTKMYQYQPVPLPHSSPPGDIIGLSAVMVAPRTPDRYTMYWALRSGDQYFCRLIVTISVHL